MRKFFIIFFVFTQAICWSQQISTSDENFKVNNFIFNSDFIYKNRIKSIKATNTTKSDGQALKKGREYYYWIFDAKGRNISEGKTIENTLTKVADTIHLISQYDYNQNLAYRTERIGKKIKSYYYQYDASNDLIKVSLKERWSFGHNPPFILSTDSFSYQAISDSSMIRRTYNDNGATYREQLYKFDDEDRIIEKSGRYLRGDIRTKEIFTYNQYGHLNEKKIYQDVTKNLFERQVLQHDKIGNIHKIKTYRNEEEKRNIDFIYFENSILLKAIIDQDAESHDLNILRFEYEYYDDTITKQ